MTIRQYIEKLLTDAVETRKLNYTEEFQEISIYISNTLNVDIDNEMTTEVYEYLEHKSEEYCHFYEPYIK